MNSEERKQRRFERRQAERQRRLENRNKDLTLEKVFSLNHLVSSFYECRKGVGWKASTQYYNSEILLNVYRTQKQILAGTYKGKGFYEFDIMERGKPRHIKSVHISERVVQRCFCDYCLVPLLSSSFIYDNGASLKGKGIHFAIRRVKRHLSKYFRRHGKDGYVYQFDVSKYFESINNEYLINVVSRKLMNKRSFELFCMFINAFGKVGLGLGSQVSQVCALLFLDKLDHKMKEKYRIHYYSRYMDDGIAIHHSKRVLELAMKETYNLLEELGIKLNPKKTQIIKLSKGFTFLKIRFSLTDTGRILAKPCHKAISRQRRRFKKFKSMTDSKILQGRDVYDSYLSWRSHITKYTNSRLTAYRMDLLYCHTFIGPTIHRLYL